MFDRHEVVIGVVYIASYTMHYDGYNPKTYQLSFRTGPRAGFGHDCEFGSPHGLTSWHGFWHYDSRMQQFQTEFRYNYPEWTDLKFVNLHRDGPITWTGFDQRTRSIRMKLKMIRKIYTPSYRSTSKQVGLQFAD